MTRRYTGFNGDNERVTPGLARFVDYCTFLTSNGFYSLGMYANRPMRGKTSTSVHATGRAVDLGWTRTKTKNPKGFGNYTPAKEFIDFLVDHQELLLLELVIDYHPAPHGQGWRCDRNNWQQYTRPTVAGAPGGRWFHIEIAPRRANDPAYYDQTFRTILGV